MDAYDGSRIGAGVTTGALARKVGISPTTLRSWDRRYGLGPAARIEGHHRRWSPEDVVMVQEMCNLTARGVPPAEAARAAKDWAAEARSAAKAPATRVGRRLTGVAAPSSATSTTPPGTLSNTDLRRRCKGIARAALRMDTTAVHEQITEAIESYGVLTAWEEVITPTLLSIDRKWESSDDKYVEVEHLLSWHVSVALHNAYARTIATNKPPEIRAILLACLPNEEHTLPLEALTATLAERGRRVIMLGGSVPVESIEATVRQIAPAAVALWSQSRNTADLPLCRHLAALRWGIHGARTRSRLLLCGPGWGRRSDAELLRPQSLTDAAHILVSASRLAGDEGATTVKGAPRSA